MPRLSVIEPTKATGRVQELFEGPLKGKAFNIFKGLANAPAALEFYVATSQALNGASLSAAEREVIQLAIAEANACDYCTAAHSAIGKMVGLTEAQTLEARRGTMADPRLNALAHFALAIHEKKGFVSDEDLARFRSAGFNDGHVAEVVAVYAQALFTNYFNHVNRTEVDFPPVPAI
jgi:uncharacterized peroxidase-related enzyme